MKRKTEDLLTKELDEIEAFDFVNTFPHLLEKTRFIAYDIRLEFPEESAQLFEISELIEDLLKRPSANEPSESFIKIKNDVALVLKQILEIED